MAEDFVLEANRKYNGMTTGAFRPSWMFGVGDAQMLPSMLKTYEKGKPNFQIGDNINMFDFTCVMDAAYAHILLTSKLIETSMSPETEEPKTTDGETFIITHDQPFYFWDYHVVWAVAGDTSKPEEIWVVSVWAGMPC